MSTRAAPAAPASVASAVADAPPALDPSLTTPAASGTALATVPNASTGDGATAGGQSLTQQARNDIPLHVREDVFRRKQAAELTKDIASLSWGKEMDPLIRQAIGSWCAANFIDPETEIDILGGKIYLNARYYIGRAQPLMHAGIIQQLEAVNISPDDRLLAMANLRPEDDMEPETAAKVRAFASWAVLEDLERERQRITYKVPPEAEVAFVGRVKLASMDGTITDAKWWIPDAKVTFNKGKQNQFQKDKDPVSDSGFAVESVQTRVYRRVLRMVIGKLPSTDPTRAAVERAEAGIKAMASLFENARIRQSMDMAERMKRRAASVLVPSDPSDPYGVGAPAPVRALMPGALTTDDGRPAQHGTFEAPTRAATAARPMDPARAAETLAERDPYSGDPVSAPAPAAAPLGPMDTPADAEPPSSLLDDDESFA